MQFTFWDAYLPITANVFRCIFKPFNLIEKNVCLIFLPVSSRSVHGKSDAEYEAEQRLEATREQLEDRIADIDAICDELVEEEPCFGEMYEDTLKHIYVLEEHKLLFCYIPKVGCSNWKRVLMKLEDNTKNLEDITSKEAHANNGLTMLGEIPAEKRDDIIDNYRKFMFVRHPLSRIVSAYKNKFKDMAVFREAPIIIRRYGMKIIRKYRKDATQEEKETGEGVTWEEWLQYIADPEMLEGFDRHWKEMYKLCSPCAINYDYIGKLENINDEADYIMDALGISQFASYPGKANSHPTGTTLEKTLKEFDVATDYQLQRISEIFGLDFCLFGYDRPDILP